MKFSGSPNFYDNGTAYIEANLSEYAGTPSPEIDESWRILTGGESTLIQITLIQVHANYFGR